MKIYISSQRDKTITIAFLRGWTMDQVGSVFKLSRNRIAQIVRRVIHINCRDFILGDTNQTEKRAMPYYSSGIKRLRRHRHRLIASIQGAEN